MNESSSDSTSKMTAVIKPPRMTRLYRSPPRRPVWTTLCSEGRAFRYCLNTSIRGQKGIEQEIEIAGKMGYDAMELGLMVSTALLKEAGPERPAKAH